MDGRDDDPGRLGVEADLDLTVAGHPIRVAGYGDLLVVDAQSFSALRALRRGMGALPDPLAAAVVGGPRLPPVDVRVRGVSVARIDPDADPGPAAALLGTAPARPSLGGVVRALLRRG